MMQEWTEKLALYGGYQSPGNSSPDVTGYTTSAPTGSFRTAEDALAALLAEQRKQTALLEAMLATVRRLGSP